MRNVLVTGVSRRLPALVADHLGSSYSDLHVVGCDVHATPSLTSAYRFVHGDIRSPSISGVLRDHRIDTLVHLGSPAFGDAVFADAPGSSLSKELTVIGTMQLLAAAGRHAELRRLVVGSSAVVYPSTNRSPALADEKAVVAVPGTTRMPEVLELESYVHQFADKRRDVDVSLLRTADVVAPGADGALARLLTRTIVPMVAGFDPRLQVLHVDDAVAAVAALVVSPVTGTMNIAPDDVVLWSHLVRAAGRWAIPLPAVMVPEHLRALLRYGNAVDNARMRATTGWAPKYSSVEAVQNTLTAHSGRSMGDG